LEELTAKPTLRFRKNFVHYLKTGYLFLRKEFILTLQIFPRQTGDVTVLHSVKK